LAEGAGVGDGADAGFGVEGLEGAAEIVPMEGRTGRSGFFVALGMETRKARAEAEAEAKAKAKAKADPYGMTTRTATATANATTKAVRRFVG
jgi:hypothetical protein